MKKIGLLVALMLSASGVMAQSAVETVYLKNGGLVKGEIIEQVPGQSLKVKTKDGNIFVYQMDEVERIAKEKQENATNGRHRGLDFSVNTGYDINTKGGGGAIATELELGKRFSKSIYWGVGAGANFSTTSGGGIVVPITTNIKTYFPSGNSSITPFAMLKAGYAINTDYPDFSGVMLSIMPGIKFPLSKTIDMNLGAGYTHVINDVGSGGAVAIRMGFDFHKDPNKPKLPPVPTRDKGFQLTLEGDGWASSNPNGGSGNVVLSYKVNPHLSFGIGGGIGALGILDDEGWFREYNATAWQGYGYHEGTETHQESTEEIEVVASQVIKAFLRAQYRFSDKRLSPFVSCDAGIRLYDLDDESLYYPEPNDKSGQAELPSSGLFVAPAVGLSLRTFNNSYLELKVGMQCAPALKEYSSVYQETQSHPTRRLVYRDVEERIVRKKQSLSAPYIALSWTHTFGSRKR